MTKPFTGSDLAKVYGERPGCRVFWDWERLRLGAEGTSGGVEVRRNMGWRRAVAGEF